MSPSRAFVLLAIRASRQAPWVPEVTNASERLVLGRRGGDWVAADR